MALIKCPECEHEMSDTVKVCPNCGYKKKKELPFSVSGLVVACILVLVFLFLIFRPKIEEAFSSPDLSKICEDYESERFCDVAYDGTWASIDTNPYDIDDYTDYSAETAISYINKKLGFDDTLEYKMKHTTALDGKQREENKKVVVEWSFHPDNGLEVLYTVK